MDLIHIHSSLLRIPYAMSAGFRYSNASPYSNLSHMLAHKSQVEHVLDLYHRIYDTSLLVSTLSSIPKEAELQVWGRRNQVEDSHLCCQNYSIPTRFWHHRPLPNCLLV